MNKNAIKKFAIDARKKLIASVTDKAGMFGITPDNCSGAVTKGADFEVYKTTAGTEVTLNRKQCEQRRKLVDQINSRGFEAVIEEVAYTWFNRICAIRFMEVNDYMYPVRVRVLSSEKEGKNEPDILTMAPDIDWDFTDKEREYIIEAKMNNKLDDLFKMLFIKQCNLLHEVLPGLFEETEDYTEMLLNISFTNEDDVVRMLIDGVDEKDFNVNTLDENGNPTGQVEIIGWLYQYYNTELKDDTFAKLKKNVKISKERIPAATQLFTPDWIVRYMVENSVGRIWIEHLRAIDPSVDEKETAEKFGWKYYLPEAEQEEEVNVKLAEVRKDYKDLQPIDIKCIDPCMGSGHILIAMFDVLMDIYESAGYDKREAAFDIVENNIHGLDIDKRAYQLAYFAVMMKGRGYNRRFFRGRDDVKPVPRVYDIMESNDIPRYHLQLFGKSMNESDKKRVVWQIEYLLNLFHDAKEYGAILNVNECDWDDIKKFVTDLTQEGQISFESVGCGDTQSKLLKILEIAKSLSNKYEAVVTNPPYMGASGMSQLLSKYVKENFADAKADMFSCFLVKGFQMAKRNFAVAMITMESWMFLSSFEKMRIDFLDNNNIVNMVHMPYLGKGGTSLGINFGTVATVFFQHFVPKYKSQYSYVCYYDLDKNASPKTFPVINDKFVQKSVDDLKMVPGRPLAYWLSDSYIRTFERKSIGETFIPKFGMSTGDGERYIRLWYECNLNDIEFGNTRESDANNSTKGWVPIDKGGAYRRWYGNRYHVVWWKNNGIDIRNHPKSAVRSPQFFFKPHVSWTLMTTGTYSARYFDEGFALDTASNCIYYKDTPSYEVLGFLNSKVAEELLNILNPTINFSCGVISLLPFDISDDEISMLVRQNIELSQKDWDSYETSWDYKKHPFLQFLLLTKIQDAFKYWESECTSRCNLLSLNEEKLNQRFIEYYYLSDTLSSCIDNREISVSKADLGRDIRSFISYAVGCMFGRYSIDKEGLMFAGGDIKDTYAYYGGTFANTAEVSLDGSYSFGELGSRFYYLPIEGKKPLDCWQVDADNIIPITDEEYFTNDIVTRFVEFIKTVYGEETLEENLNFIASALNEKGATSREAIRNYFLKDFYADHLKVYQKRPIYWLFDSGKQNGFKALIYMHRYDADTVGRIRTDYLHKAQNYVETVMKSAQYMIDNSASATEKSKATKAVMKYTKQLAEMQFYDEAIAHIANQRIEIDLDDGVKVNYAKFQGVEVAQEGKKALKIDLLAKI